MAGSPTSVSFPAEFPSPTPSSPARTLARSASITATERTATSTPPSTPPGSIRGLPTPSTTAAKTLASTPSGKPPADDPRRRKLSLFRSLSAAKRPAPTPPPNERTPSSLDADRRGASASAPPEAVARERKASVRKAASHALDVLSHHPRRAASSTVDEAPQRNDKLPSEEEAPAAPVEKKERPGNIDLPPRKRTFSVPTALRSPVFADAAPPSFPGRKTSHHHSRSPEPEPEDRAMATPPPTVRIDHHPHSTPAVPPELRRQPSDDRDDRSSSGSGGSHRPGHGSGSLGGSLRRLGSALKHRSGHLLHPHHSPPHSRSPSRHDAAKASSGPEAVEGRRSPSSSVGAVRDEAPVNRRHSSHLGFLHHRHSSGPGDEHHDGPPSTSSASAAEGPHGFRGLLHFKRHDSDSSSSEHERPHLAAGEGRHSRRHSFMHPFGGGGGGGGGGRRVHPDVDGGGKDEARRVPSSGVGRLTPRDEYSEGLGRGSHRHGRSEADDDEGGDGGVEGAVGRAGHEESGDGSFVDVDAARDAHAPDGKGYTINDSGDVGEEADRHLEVHGGEHVGAQEVHDADVDAGEEEDDGEGSMHEGTLPSIEEVLRIEADGRAAGEEFVRSPSPMEKDPLDTIEEQSEAPQEDGADEDEGEDEDGGEASRAVQALEAEESAKEVAPKDADEAPEAAAHVEDVQPTTTPTATSPASPYLRTAYPRLRRSASSPSLTVVEDFGFHHSLRRDTASGKSDATAASLAPSTPAASSPSASPIRPALKLAPSEPWSTPSETQAAPSEAPVAPSQVSLREAHVAPSLAQAPSSKAPLPTPPASAPPIYKPALKVHTSPDKLDARLAKRGGAYRYNTHRPAGRRTVADQEWAVADDSDDDDVEEWAFPVSVLTMVSAAAFVAGSLLIPRPFIWTAGVIKSGFRRVVTWVCRAFIWESGFS